MKRSLLATLCGLIGVFSSIRATPPATFIMQVSDPQMGFYTDNRDMTYETRTLTQTVEAINRLRPNAVIFTGDYVHNPADEGQWAEFRRIVAAINPRIRVLYLPGNHDVLRENGSVDAEPYSKNLGADRFSVRVNGVLLTGLNSDYLKDETRDPSKEEEQFRWLTRTLEKKKNNQVSLVFAHHPFFLEQIDEPEGYSTISPEKRRRYFTLFRAAGVHTVFTGHLHDNAEASYDGVGMITTSAVGRPLGSAPSGVRIIVVREGSVAHRYYPLGELPDARNVLMQDVR